MDRAEEILHKSWEGEILGETYFAALAQLMPEDQEGWEIVTRLEVTMGRLVEPIARAHGIDLDAAAIAPSGALFANATATGVPREDVLKGVLAITDEFLPIYRELGPLLGPDEAWISDALVTHEEAIVHYAQSALAGEPGDTQPVLDFLAKHEVTAAS